MWPGQDRWESDACRIMAPFCRFFSSNFPRNCTKSWSRTVCAHRCQLESFCPWRGQSAPFSKWVRSTWGTLRWLVFWGCNRVFPKLSWSCCPWKWNTTWEGCVVIILWEWGIFANGSIALRTQARPGTF